MTLELVVLEAAVVVVVVVVMLVVVDGDELNGSIAIIGLYIYIYTLASA